MKKLFCYIICILFFPIILLNCGKSPQDNLPERLLLLIIDGATWDVINPLMDEGKLPMFKSLVNKGLSGPLKTLKPTVSPTIWTCIATSRHYKDHGILGFKMALTLGMWLDFNKPEEKPHLVTSNLRKTKAIWNILSEKKIPVGVVNYLVSWPAEKVDGFIVTDRAIKFPGEINDAVSPKEQENEILEFIKSNKKPMHKFNHDAANSELAEDTCIVDLTLHLAQKNSPRVMLVGLRGTDAIEHQFWEYYKPHDPSWTDPECQPMPLVSSDNIVKESLVEPYVPPPDDQIKAFGSIVPQYYIEVDHLLGKLLTGLGTGWTVIIVSDHGFTPPIHINAPPGILICSGRPFIQRKNFEGYSVFDIVPTILYLLDLPVAKDMAGIPMIKGMEPNIEKNIPVKYLPTYETEESQNKKVEPISSDVDSKIMDQLKKLGYIK
ncbi:MAG: hypothetical protein A2161_20520 [Candidatus Schekmanbacteria bacterium RBG_13_48_7]|uniref:Phosphodiesterase n=1 Tax=Candidatus Schekmanbacteria bacterium RBG_13_48_7 TaxID=1817878 RepID=A0A1F7RM04_9BACT|nr:MAG: hypothetical protein A2161_20520 [Candidatus Schekmanbacteria bacterium RBG_13_48_7]